MTGITIWEAAVIPSLLYNSSTWVCMRNEDLKRLEKLQRLFLSTLFQVQNSPAPSFNWDLKILTMENRILKYKLMFIFHLFTLPNDAVAYQVLQNQVQFSFPGLYFELEEFLKNNGIHEKNIIDFTKTQWRKFVDDRVSKKNEEELLKQM